ncbi:MAG TPA: SDR family NAD(P)-dependent oxidoreductase [Saprospiraceae bacterium]|nr:SDR family NAD(P)-dependent oxidoreductase [Saprospiraceae bacterium]
MKYIFITGVSSGIGFDAMQKFIYAGYHVIGTVRKEEDLNRMYGTFGNSCTILLFDVRDSIKMASEIQKIKPKLEKHGLTCLINNAGMAVPGPLQYLSEEDFELELDVNVKSVRRITNALLPYLGTDKNASFPPGKIINISSVSGLFNSPFNGAYCISKHALESMTDVYRRELAMFGIQVIAIEPGPIKTEIWRKNLGALDKFLNTEYGETLASANKMIENSEKTALDVEVISKLIWKIYNDPNPKTRYLVHRKKLMFRILSSWLPDKWADRLVAKAIAQKDNYRPV